MSNRMFLTAMLIAAAMIAGACQSQQPSGGRRVTPGTGGEKGKGASLATYEDDIQPLLKQKCLSCHSGAQSPDLSSYELAKKAANASYREVKAGTMPTAKKDRLSDTQVAMIKSWIDGGFKKTASSSKPDPAVALVSWDGWVKEYINKTCISCHGSGSKDGDFSTYAKAKTAADAMLVSMEDGSMPMNGKAEASAITKMKKWVEAGAPESDDDAKETDEDKEDGEEREEDRETASVTYENDIKRIMNSYCISCHSTGSGVEPELDSKAKVVAAAAEVYDSVQAGRMPRTGPLGTTDKDTLKKWIDGGKK